MTEHTRRTIILLCSIPICIVTAVVFLLTSSSLFAGNEQTTTSDNGGRLPKVLLMQSGRLVEGDIKFSAGGYVVKKKNGTMLIPISQVKHTAQNRTEIYNKMRKEIPDSVIPPRLVLVRWCMAYQLYDLAEKELDGILKIEPGLVEARKMLLMVRGLKSNPQLSQKKTEKKSIIEQTLFVQEVRSLGGLSRSNAQLFTRKIQPILVNKCSNSACHSQSSSNQFKLHAVRSGRGNHRTHTEQNLAMAMKFINFEHSENSSLLTKTKSGHGLKGRSLFNGRTGKKQRDLLIKWVQSVAKVEAGTNSKENNQTSPASAKQIFTGSSTEKKSDYSQNNNLKRDAFNPDDFNQNLIP